MSSRYPASWGGMLSRASRSDVVFCLWRPRRLRRLLELVDLVLDWVDLDMLRFSPVLVDCEYRSLTAKPREIG